MCSIYFLNNFIFGHAQTSLQPLVVASRSYSSVMLHRMQSLRRLLVLWSMAWGVQASVVVAEAHRLVVVVHGPRCSTACGIFPDQRSNPRLPHWQAYS